jgi:integrase
LSFESGSKAILAAHTLGHRGAAPISSDEGQKLYLADCEGRVAEGTLRVRTFRDYKRLLGKHFSFGRTQLSEITPENIATRLKRLNRAPSERNHALVAAKIFFTWAQEPSRRYVLANPCEGMATSKRASRARVLTPYELAAVLRTAFGGKDSYSHIVAFLILSGQRRGEIAALKWEWIDRSNSTITLPSSITKNKTEHTFPYGPLIAGILEKLSAQSQYLFPASRETWRHGKKTTIFNSWGKHKPAFDIACGIAGWTLHDLRRTFGTGLAAQKVAPHVVERLINHKFGTIQNRTDGVVSAVAAIYNRHAYIEEMRAAIGIWEQWLSDNLARHA